MLVLMTASGFSQTAKKSERVSVNNTHLYYEVYGSGPPLIMLHGYSLSSKHWQPYVSDFDSEYEIYLIDLTGHGQSDPFNETLSLSSVAKDLSALLEHLGLDKVKAIGFSFGGDVLYQLTLQQPTLIESMITIGALGTWDVADFPQYQEAFTFENADNFSWIRDYHTTDERIRGIMEQFEHYTVRVADNELKSIQHEVLIMLGDDDEGIDLEEVVRARKHLPNSDLWILPNVSHGAHEGETKDDFVRIAKAFFNKD